MDGARRPVTARHQFRVADTSGEVQALWKYEAARLEDIGD
jgi:hypothetical protein